MRLLNRICVRAIGFSGCLTATLAATSSVFAWQAASKRPAAVPSGAVQAAAVEDDPSAPRVLSPQGAQPISRDAAQRSEPATVVIEDAATADRSSRGSSMRLSAPAAKDSSSAAIKPLEIKVEAAQLKGIQPGVSTVDQVRKSWGEPLRTDRFPQHVEHRYKLEPFQQVIVAFRGDKVHTIVVHLQAPLEAALVRTQLGLDAMEPAFVYDPEGKLLGQVFPERGVLFSFQPGTTQLQVTQIVLEGIHPQPFALRAESRLTTHWTDGLKDAEQALKLDPRFARAHWLNAQLLAAAGRTTEALVAAEEAVKLDASNSEYRFTRARLHQAKGQLAKATEDVKAGLAQAASPIVKARGLCLLADLKAAQRDYQSAVEHRQEAVAALESLMAQRPSPTAREAMLDAYLGIAHDIAWGAWNSKPQVVPKWLAEARAIAEEGNPDPAIANEWQMRLARTALHALSGMQGELDPTPWIESLETATQDALGSTDDPLRRGQLHWELGLSCYNAMQIYHARGNAQQALNCGAKGIENLSQCSAQRGETPEHASLLGRLYFRTGAVHAVIKSSHSQAISWYDRAMPLITQSAASGMELGRQGESLVSMAVSYWEIGQHSKALELTSQGLSQMQTAVGQGLLEDSALSVPYSNLAQMHRRMGDTQAAGKYAQLASRNNRDEKQAAAQ